MAKHGWNALQDYLSIHDKTIRFYHKFMEVPRLYTKKTVTEFEIWLKCDGIIASYTYSANIAGGSPLIRYCSPHEDWEEEGAAPHHSHHHKHDYTKNKKGEITLLGPDEWPHVGEFFEEVLGKF